MAGESSKRWASVWLRGMVLIMLGVVVGIIATGAGFKISLVLIGLLLISAVVFFFSPITLLAFYLIFSFIGIRPLPPIGGFHIQMQFMMVPVVAGSLVLSRKVLEPEKKQVARIGMTAIGLYILTVVVSTIINYPATTSISALGSLGQWLGDYIVALAILSSGVEVNPRSVIKLLTAVGIALCTIGITDFLGFTHFGISQIRHNSDRLMLMNLGPNEIGIFFAAVAVLTLAPLFISKGTYTIGRKEILWRIAMTMYLVIGMFLTASRETFVGFIGGLVVLILAGGVKAKVVSIIGVLSAIPMVLLGPQLPAGLLRKPFFYRELIPFHHMYGLNIPLSLSERLYFDSVALSRFANHPIFGIGFGQSLNIPSARSDGALMFVRFANDSYLTAAAQVGIVGTVAFVGLLFASTVLLWRNVSLVRRHGALYGEAALGLAAAFAVYLIASIVDDGLFIWSTEIAIVMSIVFAGIFLYYYIGREIRRGGGGAS
jgi:hypothetical protein